MSISPVTASVLAIIGNDPSTVAVGVGVSVGVAVSVGVSVGVGVPVVVGVLVRVEVGIFVGVGVGDAVGEVVDIDVGGVVGGAMVVGSGALRVQLVNRTRDQVTSRVWKRMCTGTSLGGTVFTDTDDNIARIFRGCQFAFCFPL